MISWDEAATALMAPGQEFELVDVDGPNGPGPAFRRAPRNLGALYASARRHRDADFVVHGERRLSYRAVFERADALATGLAASFRLGPGDRVAIAMRNQPEWIVSYLAITGRPWIVVPVNAWWTGEEMAYALQDSGTRVVIADEERADRLAAVAGLDVEVVVVGPAFDRLADTETRTDTAAETGVDGDDPAAILYTSGTTGRPKGAICTHRNVVNALMGFHFAASVAAHRAGATAQAGSQPAMLVSVPLFHVTGCHTIFLTSLLSGRKLVLMDRWNADEALRLIERERVTAFTGVPTMVWDMLRSPELDRRDTSSLRVVGNGGAPAGPELSRQVERRFEGRAGHGYGMTETSGAGAQVNGDDHLAHLGSPGRPPPVLQIEAFDDTDRLLPRGERGELRMWGSVVTPGYWDNPEATEEAFVDGWFRSGDVGHIGADGFLYLDGRSKDMVLRGGENVYCVEVERAMQEVDGVLEAVVYGLPDERLGEIVAATVHAVDRSIDQAAIAAALNGHLARFKIPEAVVVSSSPVAKLASGKFDKRTVAADHRAALDVAVGRRRGSRPSSPND
ncbi:MAG: class I adenylate-forming enzyme family protein [Acidimicrobiales bacterium]